MTSRSNINENEPPQQAPRPAVDRSSDEARSSSPTPEAAAASPRISIPRGDDDDDAPEPPQQTAARYEEMEEAMKELANIPRHEVPMPATPAQIGAACEAIVDEEEALIDALKNKGVGPELFDEESLMSPFQVESDIDASKSRETMLPSDGVEDGGDRLPQNTDATTSPATPTVENQGQPVPRRSLYLPRLVTRPHSLRDDDTSMPPPSATLEATLVQGAEATLIEPVHAIPIRITWWKKYQRYIVGGMCLLLIGLAVVVGVSLGSDASPPSFSPLNSDNTSSVAPSVKVSIPINHNELFSDCCCMNPQQSTIICFCTISYVFAVLLPRQGFTQVCSR